MRTYVSMYNTYIPAWADFGRDKACRNCRDSPRNWPPALTICGLHHAVRAVRTGAQTRATLQSHLLAAVGMLRGLRPAGVGRKGSSLHPWIRLPRQVRGLHPCQSMRAAGVPRATPGGGASGRRRHTFGHRPGARHGAWFAYKKRFFKTDPARVCGGESGHFRRGSRRSRSSGKRTAICAPPCLCDVASPAASTADAGPAQAPPPALGGAAGNRSGSAGAHVPFDALVGGRRPTGARACGIVNPKHPKPPSPRERERERIGGS